MDNKNNHLIKLHKLNNQKQILLLQFGMCSAQTGTIWQDTGQSMNVIDMKEQTDAEKNMNVI